MEVVDIRSETAAVTDSYRNQVLFDVNGDCMRLAVFEGEYRWTCEKQGAQTVFVERGHPG